MSVGYKIVLWNRQKKRYDFLFLSMVALYLLIFTAITLTFYPEAIPQTLIIRATGSLAVLMLHIILIIGPLCRINPYFLPLLYNRRHLGVTMFLMAAIHGIFSIFWFHAFGNVNPLYSLFVSNQRYDSLVHFPFQPLGFFALLILFLMAASSHDFWLKNLSPKIWKSLHTMVYVAYVLVIMHVALGALQVETSPVLLVLFATGLVLVIVLHLVAGIKEYRTDTQKAPRDTENWVKICELDDIPEKKAKIGLVGGERVAVFKYDGKLSAISNVCKHQNGPLGEGKIVDGCITCPWHGYQYLPHNGKSPEPFTEKVATYEVKIIGKAVYVNPKAFPEGTEVKPCEIDPMLTVKN